MDKAWVLLLVAPLAMACERHGYSERLRSEATEHQRAGRVEAEQEALTRALDFEPADRLALEALLRSCVKHGCPRREARVFSAVAEQPGLTTLDNLALRLRLRGDCLDCGLDTARSLFESGRLEPDAQRELVAALVRQTGTPDRLAEPKLPEAWFVAATEALIENLDWDRVSLLLAARPRSEATLALRRTALERLRGRSFGASDAALERLSASPSDLPSYFARLEWLLRTGREGEALRLEVPESLRSGESWPEWELRWARHYLSRSDWNAVLGWTEHPARGAREEARRQAYRTVAWLSRRDRKAARAQLREWQRDGDAIAFWQSTLFLPELVGHRDSLLLLREELARR